MAGKEQSPMEWLQKKGRLSEQPFSSSVPLIGTIIVRLRTAWNNVAARWVILPIIEQQNEFNALVVRQMSVVESQIFEQVIEQDREQADLIREMGELNLQISQMIRMLEVIDERLARVEARYGIDEKSEEG